MNNPHVRKDILNTLDGREKKVRSEGPCCMHAGEGRRESEMGHVFSPSLSLPLTDAGNSETIQVKYSLDTS